MDYGMFGGPNPEHREAHPFLILRKIQPKKSDRYNSLRPQIPRCVSDTLQIPRQVPQKRHSEDGGWRNPDRQRARVEVNRSINQTTPALTALPDPQNSRLVRYPDLGVSMARHGSSESVLSEILESSADDNIITDLDALHLMLRSFENFKRRQRNSVPERLLLQILNARVRLDDDALNMLGRSADRMFFGGKLDGRMTWTWSRPDQTRFKNEVVGTTGLRVARDGGFETKIILSKPLLKDDENYDRSLLLSTFLHELIHCYLFICCGFEARKCGGHTEAFRTIAKVIDQWASNEGGVALGLCDMDADLDRFRILSVPIYVGPSQQRNAICYRDFFHIIREAMIIEDDGDHKAWYIPPSGGF